MKHFYLKSIIALILIALTLSIAIKFVYPDKTTTEQIKAQNQLINTLSKGNVYISSDLLDFKTYKVFDCKMENALNINSLSRQFLGAYAVYADDYTAYTDSGSVTFKDYHMTYTPNAPIFAADTKNLTLSNAAEITSMLCAEYGIPTENIQMGVSGGGDDNISVSVMYSLDSLPIFNNALVMELSTAGLHTISGSYYIPSAEKTDGRSAKKLEDVLIEFMDECTDSSRETVITDIQLGYLLEETNVQSSTLSPVWRIIVDNSAIYYVSA